MHLIRLRRPWQKIVGPASEPATIDVPELDEKPAANELAAATYRRSFNKPTGLEPSSRVHLRVAGWQGLLESAELNDARLPADETRIDADITGLLRPQNQITIRLIGRPGQAARLSGEVALAIDDGC